MARPVGRPDLSRPAVQVGYDLQYPLRAQRRRGGGGGAQYRAFDDTWRWDASAIKRFDRLEGASAHGARKAVIGLHAILGPSGMLAYLTYMAERLEHMRRLLKPTGSIFLHCDPAASHYLKIVMDGIFGPANFRNEIVWSYRRWPSKARKFQTMHDTLLFYVKSADNRHTWNWPMEPKAAGTPKYKRWNVVDPKTGKLTTREDRSVAAAETNMRDVWNISWLQSQSKERLGYPTQKPRALVDRIVRACSNEGDVVLDPFCGCGTTIDAARRSKRRWIGIDISAFAIDLIRDRRLEDRSIPVRGIPSDMASARKLASERTFDFESWAVTRLTGFAPNTRQRGDGGVDGRGTLAVKPDDFPSRLALAQVKGGKFSVSQFRDFLHVMDRDRAAVGYFVTLEPVKSPAARQQAAMMKSIGIQATRYPRMQLWPISDYFEDRLPPIPPMCDPMTGKPMAQRNLI